MSTRVGTRFETDVLQWFRDRGRRAERLAKAGSNDEGDLVLHVNSDLSVVFELKVRRDKTTQLSLATWLLEAVKEAANFAVARGLSLVGSPVPALLVKKGNKPLGESFVVLKLEDFDRIIQELS